MENTIQRPTRWATTPKTATKTASGCQPGKTKVVLDAKGPGAITHIWFTFFPPEPHDWAPEGSATNQEMLLRIYWDDQKRPAVEAPMGDFFCNAFGKRYEVASLPVVVGRPARTTATGTCLFARPPASKSSTRARSRSTCSTSTSTGSKRTSLPAGHALFPCPISAGISAGKRQGLRDSRYARARAITSARCCRCGRAARTGSARATRKSISTARRSPRSGAPAPKIISFKPGG